MCGEDYSMVGESGVAVGYFDMDMYYDGSL